MKILILLLGLFAVVVATSLHGADESHPAPSARANALRGADPTRRWIGIHEVLEAAKARGRLNEEEFINRAKKSLETVYSQLGAGGGRSREVHSHLSNPTAVFLRLDLNRDGVVDAAEAGKLAAMIEGMRSKHEARGLHVGALR